MNRTIASLAAAAVTAGSVTGFVAWDGAVAATHTHTLKIKVTGLDGGGHETKSGFVATSRVTTMKNQLLGYEVDSGSFGASGITDRIAIAFDGGIMYLRTTPTQTGETGTVTGGAGKFAGAKGTIVSNSVDEEAHTATYTIKWHK